MEKNENAFSRKIIYKPDFIISSAKLHLKSGQLLITGHSSNKPAELYLKDLYEDNIFQVSNSNPFLREISFGRQETISWKSIDGQIIDGILTYPPNFRKGIRYPLILQIHGGPEGVSLDGWTTSPTYPIQLIAANGFLILPLKIDKRSDINAEDVGPGPAPSPCNTLSPTGSPSNITAFITPLTLPM